jgi:predicted helicase
MPAFTDLVATLAVDARVRGRQFEQICRWYLTNDPQYRSTLRRVWLWDDWPGRWGADAGIDLVAEDRAGRLWAIQAKAYDQQYAVTKADVDTFLAESSRAVFFYRLLIATTDKLSPNARRTVDAQERAIAGTCAAARLSARSDRRRSEGVRHRGPRSADHGVRDRQDTYCALHR